MTAIAVAVSQQMDGVDPARVWAFVADPAWFADDAHFNQSGTEHFTEYLAAQLSLTFAR